jgi:hypothetical protein
MSFDRAAGLHNKSDEKAPKNTERKSAMRIRGRLR